MAKRNLPSLRALTAFEAAARLGSFRRAADELGITRSAVSHQIRALEQELGLSLFRREARRAELTASGQSYFPAVREAFDRIEAETELLRPDSQDNELTVQVYVTVALKWLIPRLHDFERRHPEMKVRLWTSLRLGVRRGACRRRLHPRPQAIAHPLFAHLPLLPDAHLRTRTAARRRCHPHARRSGPPSPALCVLGQEDWRIWLKAAGVEGLELSKSLAFDSYVLAQEAAVEGRGVAMTIGPFATKELRAGTLVQPFDMMVPHRHDWRFMCAAGQRLKPKSAASSSGSSTRSPLTPPSNPTAIPPMSREGPLSP